MAPSSQGQFVPAAEAISDYPPGCRFLDWFKSHAGGRGYQTDINAALRTHVARYQKRSG
nr:BrnA antitoxin family protein [Rhizobium laguerreae]